MRTTAKTALERAGYSVALANNGKEAVEVCRSTKADLILLLLDMTIPVLSGAEALARSGRSGTICL